MASTFQTNQSDISPETDLPSLTPILDSLSNKNDSQILPDDSDSELPFSSGDPQSILRCPKLAKVFQGMSNQRLETYDSLTTALGKLQNKEFLVLPENIECKDVPPNEVGNSETLSAFPEHFLNTVYYLNKHVCPDPNYSIQFGLARMKAIEIGWFEKETVTEVRYAPLPLDYMYEVEADMFEIVKYSATANDAAWLTPLASEQLFRTKGHLYNCGVERECSDWHSSIFKKCSKQSLCRFMTHKLMYRTAFHWISPKRVWDVLNAKKNSNSIPKPITSRMNSAPSGCALIVSVAAVLDAMRTKGHYDDHARNCIEKLNSITQLSDKILSAPTKYHMLSCVYGVFNYTILI